MVNAKTNKTKEPKSFLWKGFIKKLSLKWITNIVILVEIEKPLQKSGSSCGFKLSIDRIYITVRVHTCV